MSLGNVWTVGTNVFPIVLKVLELSGNNAITDVSVKDLSLEDVQRLWSTQEAVSNADALEQGLRTNVFPTGVPIFLD